MMDFSQKGRKILEGLKNYQEKNDVLSKSYVINLLIENIFLLIISPLMSFGGYDCYEFGLKQVSFRTTSKLFSQTTLDKRRKYKHKLNFDFSACD